MLSMIHTSQIAMVARSWGPDASKTHLELLIAIEKSKVLIFSSHIKSKQFFLSKEWNTSKQHNLNSYRESEGTFVLQNKIEFSFFWVLYERKYRLNSQFDCLWAPKMALGLLLCLLFSFICDFGWKKNTYMSVPWPLIKGFFFYFLVSNSSYHQLIWALMNSFTVQLL